MRRIGGALVAIAWLAGCGGGGGGTPDAGWPCEPGELSLTGELDGAPFSAVYAVAGQVVDNSAAASPCRATLYLAEGGRLVLEWPAPLAEGGAGEARGELNAQAQGGPAVGNCDADGFPGHISLFAAEGVQFELSSFRELPACSGASRAGSLRGCARYP
jgi:hypothetical protein